MKQITATEMEEAKKKVSNAISKAQKYKFDLALNYGRNGDNMKSLEVLNGVDTVCNYVSLLLLKCKTVQDAEKMFPVMHMTLDMPPLQKIYDDAADVHSFFRIGMEWPAADISRELDYLFAD